MSNSVNDERTHPTGADVAPTQPTGARVARPDPRDGATQRLFTEGGVTLISPAVVEKIARREAAETPGVGGVHNSGLRRLVPITVGEREPQAAAEVERQRTTVDLTISVRYPEPVRQVSERVRQRVTARVRELTGLAVERVDITVPELLTDEGRDRQRRVE